MLGTRSVLQACRALGIEPAGAHQHAERRARRAATSAAATSRCRTPRTSPPTTRAPRRSPSARCSPPPTGRLATVALRPHLVWGPGDTQLVPRVLDRARSGRLRFVGGGGAVIDTTYVDDAVAAHLAALDRLAPGAACSGRAYFITSGDPRPVRDVVGAILAAGGLPPETRSVPLPRGRGRRGGRSSGAWRLLRRDDDPPMTRFLARQLATDHWFDISAARRDLGYEPQVGLDEGFRRLAAWLRAG